MRIFACDNNKIVAYDQLFKQYPDDIPEWAKTLI